VNHFEEGMRDGKILLSMQFATRSDLKQAEEVLLGTFAGDMHALDMPFA